MPVTPGAPPDYETLYRLHYARLVRLSRLWLGGDAHEAEDVTQEVFLKLVQLVQHPTRPTVWEAWLTRVTRNACRDRWRAGWWQRLWRAAPAIVLEAQLAHPGTALEDEALQREQQARLWQAFQALPTRQREVFTRRYVDGWPLGTIAESLGITTGSVKRHLFRAVQQLRQVIGDTA